MTAPDAVPPVAVVIVGGTCTIEHAFESVFGVDAVHMTDDMADAYAVLEEFPDAWLGYGPDTFGPAVTRQRDRIERDRVFMVTDADVNDLESLAWDDRRRLVWQAGIAWRVAWVVDVSAPSAVLAFEERISEYQARFDAPPTGG